MWPDARGWIGLGCYTLTVGVLWMVYNDRELLQNDAFLILAYQATKGGGEQAESSARIAEAAAASAIQGGTVPLDGEKPPAKVEVVNTEDQPVPVEPKP